MTTEQCKHCAKTGVPVLHKDRDWSGAVRIKKVSYKTSLCTVEVLAPFGPYKTGDVLCLKPYELFN